MSMIDHTGFPQPGLSMSREGTAAGRPAQNPPTDFDFWRQVFDGAQGQGMADGSHTAASREGVEPRGGAGFNASMAALSPATSDAGPRRGTAAQTGSVSMPVPGVVGAGLEASGTLITVGGRVFPTSPVTRWPVSLSDAQNEALAARAADAASNAPPVAYDGGVAPGETSPTGLQAHVVQTASGDWKVALRSSRPLSAAQALAAVAQAIGQEGMPRGQVEEVLLNGQRIYQQPRRPGHAVGIVFELNC